VRHSGFWISLFEFQSFCFFSQNIFLSWDWGARGENFLPLQKTSFISWSAFFFATMNIFLHLTGKKIVATQFFLTWKSIPYPLSEVTGFLPVRTYAPLRFAGLVGD
jgi:hypothetical protein